MQNSCEFSTRLQPFRLRMLIDGGAKMPLQASIFTSGKMAYTNYWQCKINQTAKDKENGRNSKTSKIYSNVRRGVET